MDEKAKKDGRASHRIESFASGVDGAERSLNPNAPRDFKSINVPFNEYEYRQLEKLARQTGRTKLNAIRWAVLRLV